MNVSVVNSIRAPTSASCVSHCFRNEACDCINYRPSDRICQLLALNDTLNAYYANLVNDVNWEYWRPEYINLA
jgi:PAN domain